MTPVERAARAMHDNVNPEWEWDDPDAGPLRRMYRDNARAAILAIREPTVLMTQAGLRARRAKEVVAWPPLAVWQAMIDAALEEGRPS